MLNRKIFFRYAALGVTSFSANILITILLHEYFGMAEEFAFAITLALVFLFNFFVARHHVFKSNGHLLQQGLVFLLVSILFRLGEYFLFLGLHGIIGVFYIWAIGISTAISFFLKFFVYGILVFRSDHKLNWRQR